MGTFGSGGRIGAVFGEFKNSVNNHEAVQLEQVLCLFQMTLQIYIWKKCPQVLTFERSLKVIVTACQTRRCSISLRMVQVITRMYNCYSYYDSLYQFD